VTTGIAWARTRGIIDSKYELEFVVTSHDATRWSFSERQRLRGDLSRAGNRLVWAGPKCRLYWSHCGRGAHTSSLGTYSEGQGNGILICADAARLFQNKKGAGRSRRPLHAEADYMLPLLHFFVVSSHFILAFSQSALVFGASAAKVAPANPTARPRATITETRFFIGISSGYFTRQRYMEQDRASQRPRAAGSAGSFCYRMRPS
jgi:hypothetical protein